MIGLKPLQLLVKVSVQSGSGADHVLGKLCGDIDPLPDPVLFEDLPYGLFASRIDVGRVKVINAGIKGGHDLLFRLFDVYTVSLFSKTHAAITQYRQSVSIPVFSVLHDIYLSASGQS